MGRAPRRGPSGTRTVRRLRQRNVLCLQALVALLDVELDALAFSEGAVAVHLDRAVMHENVVSPLALDEPVPLLVREPLDGALSQRTFLLHTTNDGPGSRVVVIRP